MKVFLARSVLTSTVCWPHICGVVVCGGDLPSCLQEMEDQDSLPIIENHLQISQGYYENLGCGIQTEHRVQREPTLKAEPNLGENPKKANSREDVIWLA